MASLLTGYGLEIFISISQKDNKGDRRVSEFFGDLKTRVTSKFKDEISVCFAIYQQNGFLETHCLNACLKEKIKLLVFVPVKKIN